VENTVATAQRSRERARLRDPLRSPVFAYILVAPALLFIGVFVLWPVLFSLVLSAQEWRLGFVNTAWVGTTNYATALRRPEFWNAVGNTLIYSLATVSGALILGIVLALAANRLGRKSRTVWQTVFFLPVTATMAAMAIVWRFIFNPSFGVAGAVVTALGGTPVDWLTMDASAMAVVILVGIWSNFGYALVLFLAGLAAIPRDLLEAAEIDGASRTVRLIRITWPLLSPTTLFAFIIMTVRSFENFDVVRVMTNGGPVRGTQVLSHLLHQEAFKFFNTGYASAIAVLFFLLVSAVAFLQLRTERWVHYR
jgi:multiple sugar transport system permease protein